MTKEEVLQLLEEVKDPEVPVLSVVDLGVIRDVNIGNNSVEVTITPTYSGCPAMDVIEQDIRLALKQAKVKEIEIKTVLSPAWTTDWLTEKGKEALREYGIAPPEKTTSDKKILLGEERNILCPRCHSSNTQMVSQFGSTACKALYKCLDCKEPFDYFKCI